MNRMRDDDIKQFDDFVPWSQSQPNKMPNPSIGSSSDAFHLPAQMYFDKDLYISSLHHKAAA